MDAFLFALQSAAVLSFWLSIGIVLYVYAIYPGVIWICAKVFGRETENFAESYLPPMSIVIAAHNEESVIASRIENLLALDYPDDRLEIIIASDGSTDGTVDIVNAVKNERVRVMAFARRSRPSFRRQHDDGPERGTADRPSIQQPTRRRRLRSAGVD